MFVINDKFLVRKFYLSDAEAMYQNIATNESYLRKWLNFVDDYKSVDDATRFIEFCINGYKNNSSFLLGIWLDDGILKKHVGSFGLNWINGKTAELGYWISERYSGSGIMKKSVQQLIIYIQENMPHLSTIFVSIALENQISRRLVEKLGFILQPDIIKDAEKLNGKYVDHVIYELNISSD